MTEPETDQQHLERDVSQMADAFQREINALKSQISQNPTAPASSLDFGQLDSLASNMAGQADEDTAAINALRTQAPHTVDGSTQGTAAAVQGATQVTNPETGVPEPVNPDDPSQTAADATAAPAETEPTLYEHVGDGAVDEAAWPKADVETEDGTPLYTFAGGDASQIDTASWDEYTGPTKPADPAAASA